MLKWQCGDVITERTLKDTWYDFFGVSYHNSAGDADLIEYEDQIDYFKEKSRLADTSAIVAFSIPQPFHLVILACSSNSSSWTPAYMMMLSLIHCFEAVCLDLKYQDDKGFKIDIDVPTCPSPDLMFSFQPEDFAVENPVVPPWPKFERLSYWSATKPSWVSLCWEFSSVFQIDVKFGDEKLLSKPRVEALISGFS